jgi:putative sterol carrier protein
MPPPTRARGSTVAKYLTQEWLDLQKELAADFPAKPGATARMQSVVTGAPDGDVTYHTVIEDGKIVVAALGEDADAEFTLTQSYDDAVKVLKGELDANAAFMQGRVKVTGNMGKLMSLMPLTQSPEYKAIQQDVAARTEL